MATLRTRTESGKKYYQLSWYEGGKRHRDNLGPVSRITPHDAKIALQAKELELGTGKRIFVGGAIFESHVAEYLTWHAAEYPASHKRVAEICRDAFADFHGKQLGSITQKSIDKWKDKRRTVVCRIGGRTGSKVREDGRRLSAETIAKELRTLKAVFKKAVEWEAMDKNPARYVEPPQLLTSAPVRTYTTAQLQKLYKRPLHGQHWKFISNSGSRRGEAHQLKNKHVNLKTREITFVSSEAERTKSGKHRMVPMNDACYQAAVAIQKAERAAYYESEGRLPTAAEWAERPLLPKMRKESWSRAFGRDRDACGLPPIKGSLVHALRHAYGTHSSEAGVEPRALQSLMGHAHLATTEKYTTSRAEHLHREARKVSGI